jgi:uncharacterized Zn finger protein (UPF0148 family)
MPVQVLPEHASSCEEVYCLWYRCPACGMPECRHDDQFCSHCGVALDWTRINEDDENEDSQWR